MRASFLSILGSLLISANAFTACKKPDGGTGNLKITIKGMYDTETLILYQQNYTHPENDDELTVQVLNFFMSNVKIVAGDTGEIVLRDVEYINLENNHTEVGTANQGESFTIKNICVGEYTGIIFGVGLDSATNSTTPSDYKSSSPLANNGNYWAAWDSYIFSRLEGKYKASNHSTTIPFLYHTGVGDAYQQRRLSKRFSIEKNTETELVLILDMKKVFYPDNTDNQIDISRNNVSHSGRVGTVEYEVALKSIRNIANALSIQ